MGLLQLPSEVIWAILGQAVITLGPIDFLKLRLVNRYLNHETLPAFYHTWAKQPIHKEDVEDLRRLRTFMVTNILREKVFLDPDCSNELLNVIRVTSKRLVGSSNNTVEGRDPLEVSTLHGLCELALSHLRKGKVLQMLQADTSALLPMSESGCKLAAVNNMDFLVAAAHYGVSVDEDDMSSLSQPLSHCESQYFGKIVPAAAARGRSELVERLLTHQYSLIEDKNNVESKIREKHALDLGEALVRAASAGHEATLKVLLGSPLLDPEYMGDWPQVDYIENAILSAAQQNQAGTVQYLFRAHESRSKRQPTYASRVSLLNQWVLLNGVYYGGYAVVEQQISSGVDVNCKDSRAKGDMPLQYAAMFGRIDIMRLLLEHGARVADPQFVTRPDPLYLAAEGGFIQMFRLLLEHGASINGLDGLSWPHPPLVGAAARGQTAMVRFLLDHATLDLEHKSAGMKALYKAVQGGWESIVVMLLEKQVTYKSWREVANFGTVIFGAIERSVPRSLSDPV